MITVTNNGKVIEIADAAGTNDITTIVKANIAAVGMYFQQNCVNGLGQSPYAYGKRTPGRTTKTIIRITTFQGFNYNFDCDEVANQVTWQGCTNADLLVAHADITSWLQ